MKTGLVAFALALVLAISIPIGAPAQSSASQDAVEVTNVTAAFRQAIVAHDGKGLAALFIPEGGACFNMLSDGAYAAAICEEFECAKMSARPRSAFVTFVSTTKDAIDESTNTNLQIHTDGTIATEYFEFLFFINCKPTNRRSETWQLVKGAASHP